MKLTKDELLKAAVTTKLICDRRNKFLYNKECVHPNSIFAKAKKDLRMFQQAKSLPHCSINLLSSSLAEFVNWCKLSANVYKVNLDATCNSSLGKIGKGIIVWDCIGKVCETFQAC